MGQIAGIRPQVAVNAPPAQSASEAQGRRPSIEAATPVAATTRLDAVRHLAGIAASVTTRLAERDEGDHSAVAARAAAEAAREAYIRASIAAGINPLPLP